jgi:hypothetical protein
LLDYGWYSGLGLRCGYLGVFLACVLGAYLLAVFWRERAAWLLVNVCRGKMRSGLYPRDVSCGLEMGVLALGPLRTESTYHQMQYLLSYKPPALLWAGVRGETCSG